MVSVVSATCFPATECGEFAWQKREQLPCGGKPILKAANSLTESARTQTSTHKLAQVSSRRIKPLAAPQKSIALGVQPLQLLGQRTDTLSNHSIPALQRSGLGVVLISLAERIESAESHLEQPNNLCHLSLECS